jgi:hypothetical protein
MILSVMQICTIAAWLLQYKRNRLEQRWLGRPHAGS